MVLANESRIYATLLIILLFCGIVNTQNQKCISGYGNEFLSNMDNENTFCMEHTGRTCCNADDTNNIKMKIGLAKQKSDISDACFSMTMRVLCSRCDGDIGIGKQEGICLQVCDALYLACMNEYVDHYPSNDNLPFCKKDSLICSKVSDILESSRDFCEYLGLKVTSPRQIEEEGAKDCFNGQPAAIRKGRIKRSDNNDKSSTFDDEYVQLQILIAKIKNHPLFDYLIKALTVSGLLLGIWIAYLIGQYLCCNKKKHKKGLTRQQIESIKRQRIDKFQKTSEGNKNK